MILNADGSVPEKTQDTDMEDKEDPEETGGQETEC